MRIICDFDGTVTERDTNSHMARTFAPETFAALEGQLATRELTVRDVLSAEFTGITAPLEEVVATALEIPVRPGFAELLDLAAARGAEFVLLSSGFRQLIEPILEREGLLGAVPLIANDIELDGVSGTITWRELPYCELCGEACKRVDMAALRAGHLHDGREAEQVVFIGDGFSDRCGADVADRIFARDSLAHWLDEQQIAWEAWSDFHDIARALGWA